MTSTKDAGRSRLREIDGWRAVAVMLVILHHLGKFRFLYLIRGLPLAIPAVDYCGLLGVETFFVISGFVICRMLITEEEKTGWVSLKAFYFRRVFRIIPPLGLYLLTCAFLIGLGYIRDSWLAVFWASFFLFDLSRVPQTWFLGHTWSLAVEEQFYLVFPLLWTLVPKSRRSKLSIFIFLLCVPWSVEAIAANPHVLLAASAPPGFAGICCGVLMAIHEKRARSIAKRVPSAIVGLAAVVLFLRPITSLDWRSAIYESLLVPLGISLVLLFSLERGVLLRGILKSRMMQSIGVTSYGIYLWQQLFTAPMDRYPQNGRIIATLWPISMLIVASSYRWLEKPAIRYGRSLSVRLKERSEGRAAVATGEYDKELSSY